MIYVLEQKKTKENNVYPGKFQFSFIKVGCKGVFIIRTCLHDVQVDQEKFQVYQEHDVEMVTRKVCLQYV